MFNCSTPSSMIRTSAFNSSGTSAARVVRVRGAYLRALLKIPRWRYIGDWGMRRVIFTTSSCFFMGTHCQGSPCECLPWACIRSGTMSNSSSQVLSRVLFCYIMLPQPKEEVYDSPLTAAHEEKQ